jgi:uncharacterized protein YprB with RNaseH-like and TPR domain
MVAPSRDEHSRDKHSRDKLRRAFRVSAARADAVAPVRDGELRAPNLRDRLLRRLGQFTATPRPVVELPPGEVTQTQHGPMWRREMRHCLDFVHGNVALGRARSLDGERLALLAKDRTFATLDGSECLFLDTETTGLAGGAGTVVFAYGLAFFRAQELVVEQLFLRDFGEEQAILHHVKARLLEFPVPVTFVGKSFDRHRIAARLGVHKIQALVLTPRHLDLYHLVKRAHGKGLPDTRLRTVEQHLLGLCRHDDLPGSEAPAAFLDWIRDRTGPVDRVLEHNRLDVLSLAALLGMLAGRAST